MKKLYDQLFTPDFKDVVTPNVDTIYCFVWLDLTRDPVVLHVPDTYDRYYVVQLMDAWTNTFSNIGRRTTGTDAENMPSWVPIGKEFCLKMLSRLNLPQTLYGLIVVF